MGLKVMIKAAAVVLLALSYLVPVASANAAAVNRANEYLQKQSPAGQASLLGKAVRALMQSPTGAQLVGINTRRLHPMMFGIGLGLSGVAGALLSMTYEISPSMGEPYTVTALIVITLGGFGSLAGGLLLGVVEALGMHFSSPSLKMLLSYAVFIGVLIWRPNGLFSKK